MVSWKPREDGVYGKVSPGLHHTDGTRRGTTGNLPLVEHAEGLRAAGLGPSSEGDGLHRAQWTPFQTSGF